MRGKGLLCREAPSLALPPQEKTGKYGEILGGEAASLREAPLPPAPSLPKSGWRLSWVLLRRWFRLSVGRSPIGLVVVTAADRAAVTCLGRERQKGSNDWTVVGAFLYSKENAASPRRLCQPPWTHTTCKEPRPMLRRNHLRRSTQFKRQLLFGRGPGGDASLREAASPGVPLTSISLFLLRRSPRRGGWGRHRGRRGA